LLGSINKRFLQLENQFSSEHLCFVVTKTDSSLVLERYLRKHQNVVKDLREILAERERITTDTTFMQKRFDEMNQKVALEEKQIKQTQKERAQIKRAMKKRKREEGKCAICSIPCDRCNLYAKLTYR
jgi:hypothetical protein